ncbi:hypothetical protein DN745_07635 [Bradymonas sediminis]|uniref:TPM domain-containing protein n=1 Tax=Bradymonas sediminis TaxID=1548548 RepID=A0A2Z4FKJ0_9DELT|nr:hypothetical protein DN745_07635 [Bradymonas sediminis]
MSVAAVPNPRLTNEWISDTIGLLSGQQKGRLNKKLNALQRDTDVEFVVVIVKAIDTASPAEFATQLFEQWNFGDAAQNNGLLLFVFDEKHLEVEFGHGLETVFTDDWVKSMETRVLQESRSDLRLEVGAHLVIRQIEAQKSVREPTKGKRSAPWWAWALGVLLTGGVSFFGFSRLRAATKRFQYTLDRTCKDCNKPMTLASDEEAAPHLAPGQRVEIELGTAIYQYYSCSDCAHRRVFREEKVVPRVLLCRQCQYWTLTYSSKEIGANGGQFETVLDCQNCDCTSSSILNLSDYPTLPPNDDTYGGGGSGGGYSGGSSSGGSSSGGSTGGFGGGSSGGGGAGSSW